MSHDATFRMDADNMDASFTSTETWEADRDAPAALYVGKIYSNSDIRDTLVAWHNDAHVQDVRYLVETGFPPAMIASLTSWPTARISRLIGRSRRRRKFTGGRTRQNLDPILRMPVMHGIVSQFVMSVEHQLQFWGSRRLTARILKNACEHIRFIAPDLAEQIPPSGLFHIATAVLNRHVHTTVCAHCRHRYAVLTEKSAVTGKLAFACPTCRMLSMMIPIRTGRTFKVEESVTSFDALQLRKPFSRCSRRGGGGAMVRHAVALAYRYAAVA